MRIRVYPYRQKSRSAVALAVALDGRVLRLEGSSFVPEANDVVINWGSSSCPSFSPARLLNQPKAVGLAANKREALGALSAAGVSVPRFATTKEAAQAFRSSSVVVRHKLTGHSGEGIEIVEPSQDLPDAPLYVEYIKKEDEYRVHVIGGEVALVQRKGRRRDVPDDEVNWRVRNHSNGFVFVRSGVNPHPSVIQSAVDAIRAIGLDFGGVDVVFNRKSEKAYVLEINTAVGMEGSTVDDYANGFKELLT